jgi:hypothetical protein
MTSLKELLDLFIVQALEGGLKTSQYDKDYEDLNMKVSFGQGVAARIPWISFTADGMSTSNGYYPVYLFYKEQNLLILSYGISETSEYSSNWPNEVRDENVQIKQFIPNAARYGDSYIYKIYTPKVDKGKVILERDGAPISAEVLSNELSDLLNYYKKSLEIEVKNENSVISTGLFYMEKQLEDFIIQNWESTQLGKEYELIYEEGILVSQQYRTDIGPIDILAKSKKTGSHVVIELKKNQTSDDTVGQIARYMGWVKQHLDDSNVKGIIVAGKYDKKLDYAISIVPGVEVFIYEVQFNLKEYVK